MSAKPVKYEIKCAVCGEVIGVVYLPADASQRQIDNATAGYICEDCAIGTQL